MLSSPASSHEAQAGEKARWFWQICRKQSSLSSVILATFLLGNVNFLFLVHMAQEQKQRAGAKQNGQRDGNYARPDPGSPWTGEHEKFINRASQSGQTYN